MSKPQPEMTAERLAEIKAHAEWCLKYGVGLKSDEHMLELLAAYTQLRAEQQQMREALDAAWRKHHEEAKAANFDYCGCEYCKALALTGRVEEK